MITNLIYIHIGENIPEYLYDSIYQSILISPTTKIYILLKDENIKTFTEKISKFNINLYTKNKISFEINIQCIPLSILVVPKEYSNLIDNLPIQVKNFRNSFWIYTIARFYYIFSFMKLFSITNAFHIENDIMIYENLDVIRQGLFTNKLYMVKDSPDRVIASIMYLNIQEFDKLLNHILTELKLNNYLNDMQLLGSYNSNNVEFLPFDYHSNSKYIYDSCAIGQFLGGIDPRNIQGYNFNNKNLILDNPTKGFINESCTFKLDDYSINVFKKQMFINNINLPVDLFYVIKNDSTLKQIVNLHIHSKQLYQFSSIFNIKFKDIITGDKITSLCDFIITTPGIYNYHKNLDKFFNPYNIIIIKNWNTVNINALNDIFKEFYAKYKKPIKLFLYTHILDEFLTYILDNLDKKINYNIYLHNSDHSLNQNHFLKLKNCNFIKKVYSQNINCDFDDKFTLLPIGLANSMFPHGNTLSLYETMTSTYYLKKTKNLYININPNTYAYRKNVLEQVNNKRFNITNLPIPFNEYLTELSTHYFSLCIRGNGLCTHRLFESLYLGVIPVIINNKYTNMNNYVKYLRSLNIPFYEITQESLEEYSDDFFNETLYKKIITQSGHTIQNNPALQLNFYE